MADVVKKVKKLLEDYAHPELKRPFYDGDPVVIPASRLPTIAIEMSDSTIDEGPTGYDGYLDTLTIKVIVDKRPDFNKQPGEVVAQKTLRDYVKGVDSSGNLKLNSIVGVLRKHLTLNSSVLDQLIKIDFSVIKREEILTEEAWISLTVESIVGMSSRS